MLFRSAAVLIGMAAQVAPVLAQAAGGGQAPVLPNGASMTQVFEIGRDCLNVGLIGAVAWAIKQLVPRLCSWLDEQTELARNLQQRLDEMGKRVGDYEKKLHDLHEGCIVRQSVFADIYTEKVKKNEPNPNPA